MNSKIAISAIILVAMIMGIGAISPMIPQAEAGHVGPDLPDAAVGALLVILNPPPAIVQMIIDHCAPGSGK